MNNKLWNRTDLIDEAEEVVLHQTTAQKENLQQNNGVTIEEWQENRVKITKVQVTAQGEEQIGKKKGTYVTLSLPTLTTEDKQGFSQLEQTFMRYLKEVHKDISLAEGRVLVVGLGNKTITPDAIGPVTIDAMHKEQSELEAPEFILYAPGVTGQTGFETKEFIAALTEKVKPALVIIVDALATSSSERLCRTIQLTDTGIHPGAGVGNMRAEISYESLGVPVTAIGIPTVVQAPVLIADAVERVFRTIAARVEEKSKPSHKLSVTNWQSDVSGADLELVRPIFGEWATWTTADLRQLFEEMYTAHPERLIVTPKEMDSWLMHYAFLISKCLFEWMKTTKRAF
ncbi:MAG: GPR endopeptidase [Solibacillus sp.]